MADIVLAEEDYGTIEELAIEITKEGQGDYEGGTALENSRIEPVHIDNIAIPDGNKIENQQKAEEQSQTAKAIEQALAEKFAIGEEQVIVYEKGE